MLKKYNIKKYITFAPCFGAKPSVMEVMLNRESGVNRDCTRSCKFLYKGFCTSNVTGYKLGRQQNPEQVRRPAELDKP